MTNRWVSALILAVLGASNGCRVGYEEIKRLGLGDNAGEGSGGSALAPSGGASGRASGGTSGSSQGGSPQGGSSGSGTGGTEGGEGGAPDPTGGSAGTSTGGRGGAGGSGGSSAGTGGQGGAGAGGMSGGSAGTGGSGGTAGSMAGGGAGGASGGAGGASGGVGGTSGSAGYGGAAGAPNGTLCITGMFGGHSYLLCKELRNWWAANGGCTAVGMRLVRIDDAAENQWLYDNAYLESGRDSSVWIGATDQLVEGEWRWSDGALFWIGNQNGTPQNGLFDAWYFREPNNVSTAEHCGSLDTTGSVAEWYDSRCELAWPFICESL